jgi:hypothetical protein
MPAKQRFSVVIGLDQLPVVLLTLTVMLVAPAVWLLTGLCAALTSLVWLVATLLVAVPMALIQYASRWACAPQPGALAFLSPQGYWRPSLWSWLYHSWLRWPRLCRESLRWSP